MNDVSDHTVAAKRRTAQVLVVVVLAMLGLGMSAKPLYDAFCKATGYGGTTRVADAISTETVDRLITVYFDSNVTSGLYWSFEPMQKQIDVKLGENALGFFLATNKSDEAVVGSATYNVTPIKAAPYFSKIQCFCFTEQKLEPGESVKMPVLFFVDPLMAEDKRLNEITNITLSYTFHRVKKPGDDAYTAADRKAIVDELETVDISQ